LRSYEVEGQVSNLIGIEGTLLKRLEPGQSAILKVKGMSKITAKVVFLAGSDNTLNDIAVAM
jgi:hypothetical protein